MEACAEPPRRRHAFEFSHCLALMTLTEYSAQATLPKPRTILTNDTCLHDLLVHDTLDEPHHGLSSFIMHVPTPFPLTTRAPTQAGSMIVPRSSRAIHDVISHTSPYTLP